MIEYSTDTLPALRDTANRKPTTTIRPSSGWAALNLRQVWQFRDLMMTLAARDVKLRYRQTALGAIWVVIQPLLAAGVLSFVFNRIAGLSTNGVPPILFAFIGSLAFTVFRDTLSKAGSSLVGNAQLISKIYFPRLALPLSTTFSVLLDFAVSSIMLVVLMVIFRVAPTTAILTLPIWLALLLMMAMGFGLLAAALTVSYRDVQYILPVVLNLLFFATPVAFATSEIQQKVPAIARDFYFILNPLASLIEAFRWSILGRGAVAWNYVIYASVVAVAVFVMGAFLFKKMERKFADVI